METNDQTGSTIRMKQRRKLVKQSPRGLRLRSAGSRRCFPLAMAPQRAALKEIIGQLRLRPRRLRLGMLRAFSWPTRPCEVRTDPSAPRFVPI